jgi:single-stranded-DNA-specific exonuclease
MKFIARQAAPRAAWALTQSGVHPLLAQLFAARGVTEAIALDTDLKHLLPPQTLRGIDTAATLLADAITQQRRMCVVADYDCDGATACAVALRGLALLGATHVGYVVPDRQRDGYGLTPAIAHRVADTGAQLLITVDNGIGSVDGVAQAQALGLQVIVTDHHLPGAELPRADALVNPNQPGCTFASKALAGVGVMFYVLLATRAVLRQRGTWPDRASEPKLDALLPLVGLGTVADVVPLDANNRRLVAQGLQRIRRGQMPIGMAALLRVAGRDAAKLSARDLGFVLGPRINAAGRLADMTVGIECLRTDDTALAERLATELDTYNRERRDIEGDMREQALTLVHQLIEAQADAGAEPPAALTVFDVGFHEGVVGIVAGRLKDHWHRPTFVFAPSTTPGELKGSGRSIEGFHLRDALDVVAKRHPGVLLRFGGHAMAAGCTVAAGQIDAFRQALAQVAAEGIAPDALRRRLLVDGPLPPEHCRVDVAENLSAQVWGQGFAPPLFADTVAVRHQRLLADKHLALTLQHGNQTVQAVWWQRTEPVPATATLAYQLDVNEWNGQRNVRWLVQALQDA